MNFTHRVLPVHGLSLHVVEAGPEDGSPVFLLHGFPDFWRTWEKQMEFLAQNGFRAVAPDQRGYNLSDKPSAVAAYNIDQLAEDVTGLMDAYGAARATVIGHDWGGAVAWRTAHLFPERIEKLIILNVPHSTVLKRALRTSWRQRMRSWYIFFFQIPRIPELLLGALDHAILAGTMRRRGRLSASELAAYREAWSQPGALRGMVQWYRALLQTKPRRLESPRILPPVLILWGPGDPYLGRELAPLSLDLCDHGKLLYLDDASHWVHHDAPDEVNRLIVEFLKERKHKDAKAQS